MSITRRIPFSLPGKRSLRLIALAATSLSLTACVFDSPYWAQTFATTTTAVPMQAWTTDSTRVVKIECSKAYHGGLYPFGGPEVWTFVTNITPSSNASWDPTNGVVYSAGKQMVLPAACWNADNAYTPALYMTALRATQLTASGSTQTYKVFDAAGLECLGREIGKGKSWFAWINKNCDLKYSGSSTSIPYVRIIANALGVGGAAASSGMAMAPAAGGAASTIGGAVGVAGAEPEGPSPSSLTKAHAVEPVDTRWAPAMEARLRSLFDTASPEGTQLVDLSCRSSLCRVEFAHRDEAAQMRFVAALAPSGIFSGDSQRGLAAAGDAKTGWKSAYYLAREGLNLPKPAAR